MGVKTRVKKIVQKILVFFFRYKVKLGRVEKDDEGVRGGIGE